MVNPHHRCWALANHLLLSIRWWICTSITHVKWRINRHFGVGGISVVCVKAGTYSSVGSLPRTHQSGEMMSCDSNYVKKVDTCKGAANWNQYTSPFITNRQLINEARALQLTRVSFTQLPARLDSCSVALFKEQWFVRAGVNNWLFSRCTVTSSRFSPALRRPCVRTECSFATGGGAKKLSLRTGVSLPQLTKNRNEAHVHIQMCEEQLRFAFWVWAASPLGLFLVLRNLLEETTTLQTRQRSSPQFFSVYKESKLFSNFLEIALF